MRYLKALAFCLAFTSTCHAKCLARLCYEVTFNVAQCEVRSSTSIRPPGYSPAGILLHAKNVSAKLVSCGPHDNGGGATPTLPEIESEREFFYRPSAEGAFSCTAVVGKDLTLFSTDHCCDVGNCPVIPARELEDSAPPQGKNDDIAPSVDVASRKAHPPKFPKAAENQKLSGKLLMKVSVSEQGKPISVTIEHASPPEAEAIFGRYAIDALMTWTYRPGIKAGKPYAGFVLVPLDFSPVPPTNH